MAPAILSVATAREVVANAYDELRVPVGAPPEQVASTFRALSLQRALGVHTTTSNTNDNDKPLLFQRQAVAYRFLSSLPLLDDHEYKPEHMLAMLRPLTPTSSDEASERASSMLDVAITSMEQAQRTWGLPYTNYVITVHYWLRTHVVRRRYSEFLALHKVLLAKLPVVPTIPERKWGYKMRMPSGGERAQELTAYLMRVIAMLANRGLFSLDIMDFLEVDYRSVRSQEEALAVDLLTHAGSPNIYYIVSSGWLDAWKNFVQGDLGNSSNNQDGNSVSPPAPGKVSNDHLVDPTTNLPKNNLTPARHYRCVNCFTWAYFARVYGVNGPVLMRREPWIYGAQVVDVLAIALQTQRLVRGFLGRVRVRNRRNYLLLQEPEMEARIALVQRRAMLRERMAVVRKYVNIKEYQIRHVAASKIQRAFRVFLLRAEHNLLMAESAVPHVEENFQQIEEYYSLEEIGLIEDSRFKLAHFLVTLNKGVPIQKIRSRRKSPKWRLFKINQIGSQLLWSSKKHSHALAFVDVVSVVIEAPLALKTALGRRKSGAAFAQGVVLKYKGSADSTTTTTTNNNNSSSNNAELHELILVCESACDCEALHFGLSALVKETQTRVSDGASYVDGHGTIRKKYPHAKRLIREAHELIGSNHHGPLRMSHNRV
ncbi:hypothetical protein Gpo141_00008770 [Globisporangium polare]